MTVPGQGRVFFFSVKPVKVTWINRVTENNVNNTDSLLECGLSCIQCSRTQNKSRSSIQTNNYDCFIEHVSWNEDQSLDLGSFGARYFSVGCLTSSSDFSILSTVLHQTAPFSIYSLQLHNAGHLYCAYNNNECILTFNIVNKHRLSEATLVFHLCILSRREEQIPLLHNPSSSDNLAATIGSASQIKSNIWCSLYSNQTIIKLLLPKAIFIWCLYIWKRMSLWTLPGRCLHLCVFLFTVHSKFKSCSYDYK